MTWTEAASHYKNEGDEHFRSGRYQQAITSWSRALQAPELSDETIATLYSNRCAAHLKLGDAIPALADGDACVALRPTWAKGHMRLGSSLVLLQRFDDAFKSFSRAAALEPDNREYHSAAREARQHTQQPQRGGGNERAQNPNNNGNNNNNDNHRGNGNNVNNALAEVVGWCMANKQLLLQGLMVLGVALWVFFGQNSNMSIGGMDLSSVVLIAGAVYAAHRAGMSPWQIMMLVNMLQGNRGGGRRRRGFGGLGGMGGMGGMGRRW